MLNSGKENLASEQKGSSTVSGSRSEDTLEDVKSTHARSQIEYRNVGIRSTLSMMIRSRSFRDDTASSGANFEQKILLEKFCARLARRDTYTRSSKLAGSKHVSATESSGPRRAGDVVSRRPVQQVRRSTAPPCRPLPVPLTFARSLARCPAGWCRRVMTSVWTNGVYSSFSSPPFPRRALAHARLTALYASYKDGELSVGENTCLDRCASKYWATTSIVGQLLGASQGR